MQINPGWTVIEPGEQDNVGIDFTTELGSETIRTLTWVCSLFNPNNATDPNPSTVINGAAFAVGAQAWVPVIGQVPGAVYRLDVEVVTSGGRHLRDWALLPCS